ncbi:MAG: histidine ammonia-lyase [Deltaproteobacteria bacterium]|nr:histidine ammonia-lyase [Deltaproteobacteria bacterium]
MAITLNGGPLAWESVLQALSRPVRVRIGPTAYGRVRRARAVIERHLGDSAPVYGINTGFGIFARTRIARKDLFLLQRNLVLSHAAGVGEPLAPAISRLTLLFKLQALLKGHSGVRPIVVDYLRAFLSADCLPLIPAQGSVGASGDLAPLAHMTAPLLGEGTVWLRGRRMGAGKALSQMGLSPLMLHPKEGLALVNGTQAMTAVAAAALALAHESVAHAEIAGALTIEGLFGSVAPFQAPLHMVRPHPGAVASARILRRLLAGSHVVASHKTCPRVQDPYALRCIPAVHGTVREAYLAARATVTREMESVTDNPIVFPATGRILSGGNFHGAPVAFAMDQLAIALTTLGSMAERRVEQLTNPKAGELPVQGLARKPGLHSGYMVAHVTAASLVSENKGLAHPASIDTIPTWAGQEDHVSMGMWAARKALTVAENTANIIGIELLAGAQACDLHPVSYRLGRGTRAAFRAVRIRVPMLRSDRFLATEIAVIRDAVTAGAIRLAVERVVGPII